MTDDFEGGLRAPVCRSPFSQESADTEMPRSTLPFGNERICCLLHTVMHEPVRVFSANDQLLSECLPQISMEPLLRRFVNHRESRRVGAVPEVSQRLQCFLGGPWESAQLADHEVDDVIGVTLGS